MAKLKPSVSSTGQEDLSRISPRSARTAQGSKSDDGFHGELGMPYWAIFCLYCQGYISDALLECLPSAQKSHRAFRLLFDRKPGAALACPYCNGLIGFDVLEQARIPDTGWPVFRYSQIELESKKLDDGADPSASLTDWASAFRFTKPGTHQPFASYTYAEQAPDDETVP